MSGTVVGLAGTGEPQRCGCTTRGRDRRCSEPNSAGPQHQKWGLELLRELFQKISDRNDVLDKLDYVTLANFAAYHMEYTFAPWEWQQED
jgi:hypothetical protein